MHFQPGNLLPAGLVSFWLTVTGASGGILFTSLYSFTGSTDGCFPWGNLVQGSDGNLYGTANYGGAIYSISGHGTIFQITLDGTFNALYQFANDGDGDHPDLAGVVEGPDGFFYGTTVVGGDYHDGVIFIMSPDGYLFPIYSFSPYNGDGTGPRAGLVLGTDGNFYGTTQTGGLHYLGTVFRITSDWDYSRLFSFNGTNGATPTGSLVQGRDGNFYGTTLNGGASFRGRDTFGNPTGAGTVFKISTKGALTSLFSFDSTNGVQPVAGLIEGLDGKLYGSTELGGANGYGSIFAITTNGTFNSLVSFGGGPDGAYPTARLIQGSDGGFYGTTADVAFLNGGGAAPVGSGTIFRMTPDGTLITLYTFHGTTYGVEPVAGLTQASDGNLYGVTSGGGTYNLGTIFRLSISMAPMVQKVQKMTSGLVFTWTSVAGQSYQLQYNSNLSAGNWNNLGTTILATNGTMSACDPAVSDPKRFYRVVLLQ
jgi:uncharacterized repeat protein (TIGR03803 family)